MQDKAILCAKRFNYYVVIIIPPFVFIVMLIKLYYNIGQEYPVQDRTVRPLIIIDFTNRPYFSYKRAEIIEIAININNLVLLVDFILAYK